MMKAACLLKMSATSGTSDVKGPMRVRGQGAKRFGVRAALRRFGSALCSHYSASFYGECFQKRFCWIREWTVFPMRNPKAAEGRRTPKRFAQALPTLPKNALHDLSRNGQVGP